MLSQFPFAKYIGHSKDRRATALGANVLCIKFRDLIQTLYIWHRKRFQEQIISNYKCSNQIGSQLWMILSTYSFS